MDKNRFVFPGGRVTFALLLGLLAGVLGSALFRAHNSTRSLLKTYRAPQLQQLPDGVEKSLVVEAYVDDNGRIWDYRVSNPGKSKTLPAEIKNLLIFSVFRPATFMGRPTPGTATLVFPQTRLTATRSSIENE